MQERHRNLEQDLADAQDETRGVRAELKSAQDRTEQKQAELTKELETAAEHVVRMQAKENRTARWIKQMMQLEGRFWEKRIHAGTARFQPLSERKTAIVSVLNLKGGVGKTTIAAHLGAALANRGYRPPHRH
jgi:Mrp family chromosome partitioning ATPase